MKGWSQQWEIIGCDVAIRFDNIGAWNFTLSVLVGFNPFINRSILIIRFKPVIEPARRLLLSFESSLLLFKSLLKFLQRLLRPLLQIAVRWAEAVSGQRSTVNIQLCITISQWILPPIYPVFLFTRLLHHYFEILLNHTEIWIVNRCELGEIASEQLY